MSKLNNTQGKSSQRQKWRKPPRREGALQRYFREGIPRETFRYWLAGALFFTALFAWLFVPDWQAWKARSWPSTAARVERVNLSYTGRSKTPVFELTYTYLVKERTYRSSRYQLSEFPRGREAERLAREVQEGDLLDIRFDPRRPQQAVVKASHSSWNIDGWILKIFVLALTLGAWLFAWGTHEYAQAKR